MADLTQAELDKISKDLGEKLQGLLEAEGLLGYEVETLELKPKDDVQVMGLLPGCELECKAQGFPPKVVCKVKCG